jgi:ubiquinone/menaquinone biosynthesis C-methylase UbiE
MTIHDISHRSFAAFEKAAWTSMSAHYHDVVGPMTQQAVAPLLAAANVRRGDVLLDIATGPGYVAATARAWGARVLGMDFSSEMIAVARRNFPDLSLDQADAENLPYEYGSFDVATCAFGMLHFPRPGRVVAEAYRVLRPRGRFAFTVWCGPPKAKLFGAIGEIVQRFADPDAVRLPAGPGAFMLGEPHICTALMQAAGFVDVRVDEVPCHFNVRRSTDVREFMHKCAPRTLPLYKAQTADVRACIEHALEAAGAKALADGGRIACPALLVSGTRRGAQCPSS